jgi:hypothetical protein
VGHGPVRPGHLGPGDVDVVVARVADRRVEHAGVAGEHRRDQGGDGGPLLPTQRVGDPGGGGGVGLDGTAGELHAREPTDPGDRTTPGPLHGARP